MNEALLKEFYQITHRLHQCQPIFKKHGELSNVEFFILIQIGRLQEERKDGITLRELIGCTEMTMSAASKKVSILEKKGLVKREPSKLDKRNISITLTPSGEKLCHDEKKKKDEWMMEILSRMGETDVRQMFDLYNKMIDIIEEIEKEGEAGNV